MTEDGREASGSLASSLVELPTDPWQVWAHRDLEAGKRGAVKKSNNLTKLGLRATSPKSRHQWEYSITCVWISKWSALW
jgi:hypothetical protein